MHFPPRWQTCVDSYVYHVNDVKMYSEGRQDTITLKKKRKKKKICTGFRSKKNKQT